MQVIKSFNIESGGGGTERFAIELAKALDSKRFEVSICGLWDYSTEQEQVRIRRLESMGLPAFSVAHWDDRYPYRNMLLAMRGLRSACHNRSVDIVNAHSEFADVAILSLWNPSRRPTLIRTLHYPSGTEWINQPFRRYLFSYFLLPLILDVEIGVSQRLVDQLNERKIAKLLGRKAHRIYNAVNLERFVNVSIDAAEKRNSLKLPSDALIVGTIGRLSDQKGYSYLIEAAKTVLMEKPQVFFLIIGEGELFDQLRNQAGQKGISDHIIFTGGRSDIEELFACMALFVSSSCWEGLPTVILESMGAGIPVVATDIPGTRDLIREGQNGWLVPPKDASALATAILNALNDVSLRRVFAKQAREDVRSFSIKTIAAEYQTIYEDISLLHK